MKAILTVLGNDRVGIIASISNKLAQFNANVEDISQTIILGKFTMVMAVDVSGLNISFVEFAKQMADLGKEMKLSIRVQKEEIFDAMYTV